MRYTKADFDRATALLESFSRYTPGLVPSDARALGCLRTAYLMQADVPLSEVKNARAIIAAADGALAQQLSS